jgi:hypothetical protein
MKLPVQIKPLLIPSDFYTYWNDYGKCKACNQDIRHEMHLYNHYRKYHRYRYIKLHYYMWLSEFQRWVEVTQRDFLKQRRSQYYKRPTAIAREAY